MLDLINPRQTVLITCRGRATILGQVIEKDTISPVDWHTPCNMHPFLYGIVLAKDSLSLELIHQSKNFVVNFIGIELKDVALFCGRTSGRHTDKYAALSLEVEPCTKIECSRLRKAIGYLECEVVHELSFEQYILVVGTVIHHEMKQHNIHRLFHVEKDVFTTVR